MVSDKVNVGLAHCANRRQNTYHALDLIREDITPKIARQVMLKPNFLSSQNQLASTHPDAIRGVIDFLLSVATPPDEIIIAEGGNEEYSGEAFDNFGYRDLDSEYPVAIRLVDLNQETRWQETSIILNDRNPVPVRMPKIVLECPCTFSVAVAKTHDVCVVTLALKNMIMGTLHREDRIKMHGFGSHPDRILPNEAQVLNINLMRVARHLRPDIGVIDGTVGLQGNGPGGTDVVPLGVAAASADVFAADAVMAKAMGFEPMQLGVLHYAEKLGMGAGDLQRINVVETAIDRIATAFTPHETTALQLQWQEENVERYLAGAAG